MFRFYRIMTLHYLNQSIGLLKEWFQKSKIKDLAVLVGLSPPLDQLRVHIKSRQDRTFFFPNNKSLNVQFHMETMVALEDQQNMHITIWNTILLRQKQSIHIQQHLANHANTWLLRARLNLQTSRRLKDSTLRNQLRLCSLDLFQSELMQVDQQ